MTISEKVQLIDLDDKNKMLLKSRVVQKCEKTVIYDMLKNKEKITDEWITGNGAKKRKLKIIGNEDDYNKLVWEWCGFPSVNSLPNSSVRDACENIQVIKKLCQEIPDFECDVAANVKLDEGLLTEQTFKSAAVLLLKDHESDEKDENECEECDKKHPVPTSTHVETVSRIQELLSFVLHHFYSETVQSLYQVDTVEK